MPLSVSILKMTLFQSISKPAGRECRGWRSCRHCSWPRSCRGRQALRPTFPARHRSPRSCRSRAITSRRFSSTASTTCSTPSLLGEVEPQRIDVGDDDLARADPLRHQRAHDADRTGAGDEHVLADADRTRARCAPHCRADRRSRRSRRARRRGSARRCASGMQTYSRERAGPVDADAQRVAAEMAAAGTAVAALAADDVALARNALADVVSASPPRRVARSSPTNSWPVTIGTGTVFAAHSSQL